MSPRPTRSPSHGGEAASRRVGQLTGGLELVNRDHRPMPAGLGLHPYFPKTAGTILRFDCTGVWPPDAPEAVAQSCGPLEDGLDFTAGRDIGPLVLDRCVEGWDGAATLTAPDGFATRSRRTRPSAISRSTAPGTIRLSASRR
jgi:galactose mutarotase-like enzyme